MGAGFWQHVGLDIIYKSAIIGRGGGPPMQGRISRGEGAERQRAVCGLWPRFWPPTSLGPYADNFATVLCSHPWLCLSADRGNMGLTPQVFHDRVLTKFLPFSLERTLGPRSTPCRAGVFLCASKIVVRSIGKVKTHRSTSMIRRRSVCYRTFPEIARRWAISFSRIRRPTTSANRGGTAFPIISHTLSMCSDAKM